MPEPRGNETREDFMERCIPIVLEDGTAESNEQAFAVCNSMYGDGYEKAVDPDELDAVFAKYRSTVNMSASELERWRDNPCSREASLDRSPIRRNLRLLRRKKSEWTSADIRDANKTIGFVSRMKNAEQGKPVSDACPISKRDISLKNWAYDPAKKKGVTMEESKPEQVINITINTPKGGDPVSVTADSAGHPYITSVSNKHAALKPPTKNTLKAVGGNADWLRVANYIVLFGGRDLEGVASDFENADGSKGNYFTKNTRLDSAYTDTGRLFVDWEHGYGPMLDGDGPTDDDVFGYVDWATKSVDQYGVWVERVLNRRAEYMRYIEELIAAGLIGNSSEAVAGGVSYGEDGEIKSWPLKRDTLTVSPMEPRMLSENAFQAAKALGLIQNANVNQEQPEGTAEDAHRIAAPGTPAGDDAETTENNGGKSAILNTNGGVEMPEENEGVQIDYDLLAEKVAAINKPAPTPAPAKSAGFVIEDELDRKARDPNLQPYKSIGEQLQDVALSARTGRPSARLLAAHKKSAKAISGMSETIGADGGFLVQTDFVEELLIPMYGEGEVMRRITNKLQTSRNSNSVEIPTIQETTRANGVIMGGVLAYRRSEGNSVTNTQPTIDLLTLKLNAIDVLMYATDELIQDQALLSSQVLNNVPTALIVKTEGEVFNGTGSGQMRGIIGDGGTVTIAKETGQAAATITSRNIQDMWQAALPGPTDYVWYCTRVVAAELQRMDKTVGTGGELVYMPPGGVSGTPYATLMGDPVVIVPYTSALGTVGDIVYGAMSKYRYIDKGSILAAQSMHVRFIQSEMTFKWTLRNDGQPESNNTVTSYNGEISQGFFVELATRA